jgi:hypothetical protein
MAQATALAAKAVTISEAPATQRPLIVETLGGRKEPA